VLSRIFEWRRRYSYHGSNRQDLRSSDLRRIMRHGRCYNSLFLSAGRSMDSGNQREKIVVIGAGPAGLGAAFELARQGVQSTVVDRHATPGGLARTTVYRGCSFDIGPHRFFTKNDEVHRLWVELLGQDFQKVYRLTRIYYQKKFFKYPLEALDVVRGLGFTESMLAAASYLWGRLTGAPASGTQESFETHMTAHFGVRLYRAFFKTYTEKLWGIPCSELSAAWAGQRIKNLNLREAAKSALIGSRRSRVRSLVDEFEYPVSGAGLLYEKMVERIRAAGSEVLLETQAKGVLCEGSRIAGIIVERSGQEEVIPVKTLFSSMPITELVSGMRPAAPAAVLDAAKRLRYRDHITVNLLIDRRHAFPDQWIYVHDPGVRIVRLANYANFSAAMAQPDTVPVSVEYFVFAESDDLWQMPDDELVAFAAGELAAIGICDTSRAIPEGFVVREKDAYPAYFRGYEQNLEIVRSFASGFANLQLVGRGGMFRYNNQDHALLTGIMAARNLLGSSYDIWSINADDEYLETEKMLAGTP
jgi:protoporphyrinogen oxidase